MVSEIEDDKVDDDYEEPLSEDSKEESEDSKEESEDYKEQSEDHTEQSDGDGDEFDDDETDLDEEHEASPKERAARALEIRRALEVRDEQRRLSEDLDYLEFDDD